MDEPNESVQDLYFRALGDLASEKGDDFARAVAAETIANLLSMVSKAAYRLPEFPIFLPPDDKEPEAENGPTDRDA